MILAGDQNTDVRLYTRELNQFVSQHKLYPCISSNDADIKHTYDNAHTGVLSTLDHFLISEINNRVCFSLWLFKPFRPMTHVRHGKGTVVITSITVRHIWTQFLITYINLMMKYIVMTYTVLVMLMILIHTVNVSLVLVLRPLSDVCLSPTRERARWLE